MASFDSAVFIIIVLNIILALSLAALLTIIINAHRGSLFSKSLFYWLAAICQFGIIQITFLLIALSRIRSDVPTISFLWHMDYYLGLIAIFFAARSLIKIIPPNNTDSANNPAVFFLFMSTGISVMGLMVNEAISLNNQSTLWSSRLQEVGIYHYASLISTLTILYYISQIRLRMKGAFTIIASPVFYSLIGMCTIHFLELMVETWKVAEIDYRIIEGIEVILWLPVFIGLNYAFWKLYLTLKSKLII